MKNIVKIVKIFLVLLLLEFLIGIISASFGGVTSTSVVGILSQTFNFLMRLLSYPLFFFDKTYPYYAMISFPKVLGLIFLNTFLQSMFIWVLLYRNEIKK